MKSTIVGLIVLLLSLTASAEVLDIWGASSAVKIDRGRAVLRVGAPKFAKGSKEVELSASQAKELRRLIALGGSQLPSIRGNQFKFVGTIKHEKTIGVALVSKGDLKFPLLLVDEMPLILDRETRRELSRQLEKIEKAL